MLTRKPYLRCPLHESTTPTRSPMTNAQHTSINACTRQAIHVREKLSPCALWRVLSDCRTFCDKLSDSDRICRTSTSFMLFLLYVWLLTWSQTIDQLANQRWKARRGRERSHGCILEHAYLLLPQRLRLRGAAETQDGIQRHQPHRPMAPEVLSHSQGKRTRNRSVEGAGTCVQVPKRRVFCTCNASKLFTFTCSRL